MSEGDGFVGNFEKKLTDLNEQETFQSAMTYEEDQELIQNTEKAMAYEEGTKNGVSQGIEQRNIEIAKNMLKDTQDYELISKYTGLDTNTLQKLSKEAK